MEIKRGRMVHLGYDKFWRSDHIVGLRPIEDDRGPGRRTEVYVATRPEPVIASRTERSILRDMVTTPEDIFHAEEAKEVLEDLLADLADISPLVRRMLRNEENVDVDAWVRRLSSLLGPATVDDESQEDLFTASD